jgi:predicted RecB family endonuclease
VLGGVLGLLHGPGEDAHALLHGLLVADGDFADGLDALLHELGVDLVDVLLELLQDGLVVLVVDDARQDLTESPERYIFSFLT